MDLDKYLALAVEAVRVERARRASMPTMPYKLQIFTTFACTSRCRTCDLWRTGAQDAAAGRRELTPDDLARTVASGRDHLRWLSLTGGEVTERPDFVEIVRRVMAVPGLRLALINVTTNGLNPDRVEAAFPDVFRLTRGVPLYVTVSLEADDATYRKVRGVRDGLRRARASLDVLRSAAKAEPHVMTGYQVTLSGLNADAADRLVGDPGLGGERAIVGVAADAFLLTRGRLAVDARGAPASVARAVGRLGRAARVRGLHDLAPKLYLGIARDFLRTGRSPLACTAGWGSLTLDPYGAVYPCFFKAEPLASLRDHAFDLAAMVRSPEFRRALAPLRGCRDCWSPCQAFPTMIQRPVAAILAYLGSVARDRG
jgi:MoaA/NifB/PqqE/SkfB family radical SAM enzyme